MRRWKVHFDDLLLLNHLQIHNAKLFNRSKLKYLKFIYWKELGLIFCEVLNAWATQFITSVFNVRDAIQMYRKPMCHETFLHNIQVWLTGITILSFFYLQLSIFVVNPKFVVN